MVDLEGRRIENEVVVIVILLTMTNKTFTDHPPLHPTKQRVTVKCEYWKRNDQDLLHSGRQRH